MNPKQLSITGLVAVIVIAVCGIAAYESQNYSVSARFHGTFGPMNLERAHLYAASATSCDQAGDLSRKLKGDDVAASCIDNVTKRTELRMEFASGLTIVSTDGDVTVLQSTEEGYEVITSSTADELEEVEPTEADALEKSAADFEAEIKETRDSNGVLTRVEALGYKLVIDTYGTPGDAVYFGDIEKDLINQNPELAIDDRRRTLLSSRFALRNSERRLGLWKKVGKWVKKTVKKVKKVVTKVKKTAIGKFVFGAYKIYSCAKAIIEFGAAIVCCIGTGGVGFYCCVQSLWYGYSTYSSCFN